MVNYQVGNWTLYHEELGTSPYIVECSDWVFYCTLSGNKQYSIGSLHFYVMFFHYIIHGKLPQFTSHSDQGADTWVFLVPGFSRWFTIPSKSVLPLYFTWIIQVFGNSIHSKYSHGPLPHMGSTAQPP